MPTNAAPSSTTPHLDALIDAEPDLVDRIFEYLLAEYPQIAGARLAETKAAVRAEFRGEEVYIPARGATDRQMLAGQVLALFNGRNASEVARRLRIGRTTVWRIIKQAGVQETAASRRSSFPGNGTANPIGSPTDPTALAAGIAAMIAARDPESD